MTKKVLFWTILALVMIAVTGAYAGNKVAPRVEHRILTGYESLPDANYEPAMPGLATDSPGELVGTTQYDYQTNGSSGNRCAVDANGGVHFVWMNGISYPTTREVRFNYVDASGSWLNPVLGLSQVNGAGYCQASVTNDNRTAAVYHSSGNPSVESYVTYAEDTFTGFGIFQYFDPPDMLFYRTYWPYFCIDRNDNIHVVSCENPPEGVNEHALGYTVSTDGGTTWSMIVEVDFTMTLSQNVVASPVSDKVAIVYAHPNDYITQWENDIYYIESLDGLTWDWRFGKVNVTNYSDSVFAYTDLAAIYDYNDNLNIIWNAHIFSGDSLLYFKTPLMHYSTGSGQITQMYESPENWVAGCEFGAWNRPVCKMSLGVHEASGNIFTVYTAFVDTLDCSAGGFANGEIFMQYSADGGGSWELPINLTNSQTPGCVAGDCDSDHWSSLADKVDGNLHIIYIEDKDAGGIPQTEGQVTTNPVRYLEYPTITSVYDNGPIPTTFEMAQNYPNPFNAQTNIDFDLEDNSIVKINVYDITGAKVITLVDGVLEAGSHSINWNAEDVSSGVYYYKMKTNGEERTMKMTLLK